MNKNDPIEGTFTEVAESQEVQKTYFIFGSERKIDGFVNIGPGTALEFDPSDEWPFDDGIADEIAFHGVLNTLPPQGVIHFIRQAYRILKPFGMIDIIVPVQSHPEFEGDLFQLSNITEHTFKYFNKGECDNAPLDSYSVKVASLLSTEETPFSLSTMKHEEFPDSEGRPYVRWMKLVKI
jgi:hypothetical protein